MHTQTHAHTNTRTLTHLFTHTHARTCRCTCTYACTYPPDAHTDLCPRPSPLPTTHSERTATAAPCALPQAGLRVAALSAALDLNRSLQGIELLASSWEEQGLGLAAPFLALGAPSPAATLDVPTSNLACVQVQ